MQRQYLVEAVPCRSQRQPFDEPSTSN